MADPFDILGLAPRFDLGEGEIRRAYLARAAQVHPDTAGGEEDAEALSAELNRAKRTLEDPERRANALLARLGGPAKEEDRSLPSGFLMEMMEVRERMEEAVASGDPARRTEMEAWAAARREAHASRVKALFEKAGGDAPADVLRAIRTELNAWRYVERMIEQLDPSYDPSTADFRE